MLDGYGLHTIIWDSADERLGDFLVASPADATGPTGPQGPAGTTPDLSAYATKQYVDDAIAALANLEEEDF